MLRLLLNANNLSLYKLEKSSHVCHATLNDLYNERTNVENCSSSLLHKIAQALNMSMDKLYGVLSYDDLSLMAYDDSFDLFKSNVCHELKELGDKEFLKKHLSNNTVINLYKEDKTLEALYLIAMLDFICNQYHLPIVEQYEEIRIFKMTKLIVPKSVYLLLKSKSIKITNLFNECIDEFLSHNIMEANIYDVH